MKQVVNEYHVYDDSVTNLGGTEVITKEDGSKVVRLTIQQAQFFVDQGVIGRQAKSDMSDESKAIRRQFRGQAA